MAKVSVIMTVYNSEKYLEECILSALNQTYEDFELIIIDDGSSDGSGKICQDIAKKDSRLKYHYVENGGVSAARNYGMKLATGEYIRFMDADDTVCEDSLKYMVDGMESRDDVDVVIGAYDTNDEFVYKGDLEGYRSMKEFVEHFSKMIPSFYYGVTWNKLYKKSLIDKYNIEFEVGVDWAEDFLFNIEYFKKSMGVYYISQYIYYYNRRENSLVSTVAKYDLNEAMSAETRRFVISLELVKQFTDDKDVIDSTYNFYFTKVNYKLNDSFTIKNSKVSHRKMFVGILKRKDVSDVLKDYPYKNTYLNTRLMINAVKKKRYTLVYLAFLTKHLLKKMKFIRHILKRNNGVMPKYSL